MFKILRALAGAAFIFSAPAQAGIMEISYTFSQRSSFIDDNNYQKSMSHTGSVAWYFFELSALEMSYTRGEGQVSGKATGEDPIKLITTLEMYDASLVLTIAQKDWAFQPYIKGGGAMVNKKIYRKTVGGTDQISQTDKDEIVPSFGAGFRFYMTKNLSFRAGYDRWRSGKDSSGEDIWDDAIRAGLSFNF